MACLGKCLEISSQTGCLVACLGTTPSQVCAVNCLYTEGHSFLKGTQSCVKDERSSDYAVKHQNNQSTATVRVQTDQPCRMA